MGNPGPIQFVQRPRTTQLRKFWDMIFNQVQFFRTESLMLLSESLNSINLDADDLPPCRLAVLLGPVGQLEPESQVSWSVANLTHDLVEVRAGLNDERIVVGRPASAWDVFWRLFGGSEGDDTGLGDRRIRM